jgi:hypothetical protein
MTKRLAERNPHDDSVRTWQISFLAETLTLSKKAMLPRGIRKTKKVQGLKIWGYKRQ